jgi:AAA+ ATPase superfamily predicted ATPase
MKIYTKSTYREIIDFIDVSNIIKRYLRIKKVPHFTTIQKKKLKDYLQNKLGKLTN